MSLRRFFIRHASALHLRMYEFEFEYYNGRDQHEITLAYVVSNNEIKARLELLAELKRHNCELICINDFARKIEPDEFDEYIRERWPDFVKELMSNRMLREHDHHVYVLPPIEIIDT